MSEAILLGSFLVLVILGLPVAFALGISSLTTMVYLQQTMPAVLAPDPAVVFQKIVDGMDNFSLMAIPFFILAGQLMAQGGMARRLVDFSNLIVGRVRGGLSMVNILASMFFGGISGSSVADTSSIGSILIPMMTDKGYDRDYSTCVTITSSTQGIIIPPSHNAILYAFAAGGTVSVAEVFMAGIVPGVLVGLALMAVSYVIAVRRGYPAEASAPWRAKLRITARALLGLITAVIIVGGILGGVFTPTESSTVAVVYAFIVTYFVYRDVSLRSFGRLLVDAIRTISVVMLLIGTAASFGYLVAYLGIPEKVTEAFASISSNRLVTLALINIMLLALGTIMDMAPLILITTPILLPVAVKVGMHPVHFGIMLMLNLGIGLCTPPVGSTLFVGCAVGRTSIERVTRAIWPFYLAMVAVLLLVTYAEPVTMMLPRWFE